MEEIEVVATEILDFTVKSLSQEFIYFSYLLGKLDCKISSDGYTYTDGKNGYFSPKLICESMANNGERGVGAVVLHELFHCLFLHPFKVGTDSLRYDLACDIVVNFVVDGLGYGWGGKLLIEKRKLVYKSIIDRFSGVTDKTCAKFCEGLSVEKVEILSSQFKLCSHFWRKEENREEEEGQHPQTIIAFLDEEESEEIASSWANALLQVMPQIGKLNVELKRTISAVVSKPSDYKSFLRKFLKKRERLKSSDEEFDYIFYCLGLNLYKNTPLIENLEYSDRRDLSEIVIAIDTSGSTDGEPVKRFLKEVYSVIKSVENEGQKFALRIIQCDLKIQKTDVVYSSEQFNLLLKNYELLGGGGTDFRPVFDELINLKKSGIKIEGLIYFTDGVGVYPVDVPPFKTCFAVLGEEDVQIPHFAYKLELRKEDLT